MVEDCAAYMRTGACEHGANCQYRHGQTARDLGLQDTGALVGKRCFIYTGKYYMMGGVLEALSPDGLDATVRLSRPVDRRKAGRDVVHEKAFRVLSHRSECKGKLARANELRTGGWVTKTPARNVLGEVVGFDKRGRALVVWRGGAPNTFEWPADVQHLHREEAAEVWAHIKELRKRGAAPHPTHSTAAAAAATAPVPFGGGTRQRSTGHEMASVPRSQVRVPSGLFTSPVVAGYPAHCIGSPADACHVLDVSEYGEANVLWGRTASVEWTDASRLVIVPQPVGEMCNLHLFSLGMRVRVVHMPNLQVQVICGFHPRTGSVAVCPQHLPRQVTQVAATDVLPVVLPVGFVSPSPPLHAHAQAGGALAPPQQPPSHQPQLAPPPQQQQQQQQQKRQVMPPTLAPPTLAPNASGNGVQRGSNRNAFAALNAVDESGEVQGELPLLDSDEEAEVVAAAVAAEEAAAATAARSKAKKRRGKKKKTTAAAAAAAAPAPVPMAAPPVPAKRTAAQQRRAEKEAKRRAMLEHAAEQEAIRKQHAAYERRRAEEERARRAREEAEAIAAVKAFEAAAEAEAAAAAAEEEDEDDYDPLAELLGMDDLDELDDLGSDDEAERVAAERAEAERVAAERAEVERLAAEQREAERRAAIEAERRRAEAQHRTAEQVAEARSRVATAKKLREEAEALRVEWVATEAATKKLHAQMEGLASEREAVEALKKERDALEAQLREVQVENARREASAARGEEEQWWAAYTHGEVRFLHWLDRQKKGIPLGNIMRVVHEKLGLNLDAMSKLRGHAGELRRYFVQEGMAQIVEERHASGAMVATVRALPKVELPVPTIANRLLGQNDVKRLHHFLDCMPTGVELSVFPDLCKESCGLNIRRAMEQARCNTMHDFLRATGVVQLHEVEMGRKAKTFVLAQGMLEVVRDVVRDLDVDDDEE